ncbi:hypothetical protein [Paenibacillus glycinis]|uniref:Uncharacterized protein n=1 Tax=Paenibacillus glycinis TaxID=2697035 RepID=A0ABW9XK80_9BACL|nr:hypothetical protein [Paenibacillus glycinis]NBD23025.1 hypothetical protein [Paenibacillus glycinis]
MNAIWIWNVVTLIFIVASLLTIWKKSTWMLRVINLIAIGMIIIVLVMTIEN